MTFTFATSVDHPAGSYIRLGAACDHSGFVCPSGCDDWQLYAACEHRDDAIETCGCQAFDLNVSNANARRILARLGLDPTADFGEVDADDLLGRALVANVGRSDSGTPDEVVGNMVDCGRSDGYFTRTLAALADLAVEARNRGVKVGWG